MQSINRVFLIGNVGQDPRLLKFDGGGSKAEISIATEESYKDKEGVWQTITDWTRCYGNDKLAERISKDIKKGYKVHIEGKIKNRSWIDGGGVTQYMTEIKIIKFIVLVGAKKTEQKETDLQTKKSQDDGKGDDDLPF